MWHDSFILDRIQSHVTGFIFTTTPAACSYEWVTSHMWHDSFIRDRIQSHVTGLVFLTTLAACFETAVSSMGWLQLVRSLKSWVSSAEYRLSYRALLPKRPTDLRSLLIVATSRRVLWDCSLIFFTKFSCTVVQSIQVLDWAASSHLRFENSLLLLLHTLKLLHPHEQQPLNHGCIYVYIYICINICIYVYMYIYNICICI